MSFFRGLVLALASLALATTGAAMSKNPSPPKIAVSCEITGNSEVPYQGDICPEFTKAVALVWESGEILPEDAAKGADLSLTLHAKPINNGLMTTSISWIRGDKTGESPTMDINISDAPLNATVLQRGYLPLLREIAKAD